MTVGILDYLDKTHGRRSWKQMFQTCFEHVLQNLGKEGTYEVSLSLIDDEEQRALNRQYRKLDRTTDVLTFAYLEDSNDSALPVVDLGSITISPQVAKRQAKEFRHPLERELCFLFIHGLLHIFGYDHESEADATIMFETQNRLLNDLPIDFYTDFRKLEKLVKEAQSKAIAPYSNFHVGAVIVTKDGSYISGFNIENASYPATICAERVALYSAYQRGYRKEDIVSLGLVTESQNVGTCCGVCRQVMSELMNPSCPVYIYANDMKKHLYTTVRDLLPYVFTPEDLNR